MLCFTESHLVFCLKSECNIFLDNSVRLYKKMLFNFLSMEIAAQLYIFWVLRRFIFSSAKLIYIQKFYSCWRVKLLIMKSESCKFWKRGCHVRWDTFEKTEVGLRIHTCVFRSDIFGNWTRKKFSIPW